MHIPLRRRQVLMPGQLLDGPGRRATDGWGWSPPAPRGVAALPGVERGPIHLQLPEGLAHGQIQTLDEKVPYKFRYEFECDDTACRGHKLLCTDWEMGESWRRWKDKYGDQWEEKFRQKYESYMINERDTHFFVGTIHQHPKEWIIVSLFCPPPEAVLPLIDATEDDEKD